MHIFTYCVNYNTYVGNDITRNHTCILNNNNIMPDINHHTPIQTPQFTIHSHLIDTMYRHCIDTHRHCIDL